MQMTRTYISRTLIANRGCSDERVIAEAEIPSIDAPTVILGDPGLGKTELTKMLEEQFGYFRIPGGTFYRNQNVARFSLLYETRL
jgi:MoxR-like ATPase